MGVGVDQVQFVAGNALDSYDANLCDAVMDRVVRVTESHAIRQQPKPSGLGYGRRIGTAAQQSLDGRVLETPGFSDLQRDCSRRRSMSSVRCRNRIAAAGLSRRM